jgi:tetratricopeptide (TPR) repeat protein
MKRAGSVTLEEESRRAFINLLPPAWIHRDKNPDYGIDMEVEIVEGSKVTNEVFWVQLKSTENIAHSDGVVPYSMETKHLKYYEGCRLPVVILLWVKPENTFYYLFAQRYIREKLSKDDPNWRTQKTKTIELPANLRLKDADKLKEIATDGYFYIVQQEPSVRSEAGSAVPWLDGIPKSNDEVLKDRTLKGLLCMRNEDYEGAIAEYKHILRVICKTSSTERMSILLNLGIAYSLLGQNDEALTSYGAVLELAKEVGGEDALAGEASTLGNIGIICKDKGDLDNALKHFQDALKIDREIGYRQGEANQLGNIGNVCKDKGDLDNALKHFQDALKIQREVGYRQGEASTLGNIGIIYSDRGDLDNALKHHQEALKIDREIGYRQGEACDLGNIGVVYTAKGDLDNALKHHQEALKIDREIGYRQGEACDLGNIGVVYRVKGDLDNVLKHHQDALKIDREIGYRQGEASDLGNIGVVYKDKGDLDNALKHFQDALKIDREIGYRQGEANQLGNIGIIYSDRGDLDNALKHLQEALSVLDRHNLTYGRSIIQRAIESVKQRS